MKIFIKKKIEIFYLIRKYGFKKHRNYKNYFNKKIKGKVTDNYIHFSQFYYPEDVGTVEITKMKNGRLGKYEIVEVKGIDDFGSENIRKDFIGYVGIKPIRECVSVKEFMELYDNFLKT